MATPSVLTFDAEGRAIDFDVWVDDLQLFLQCDRADGLSLFDLTSGASPAPAADADATVRSQWATRDAAARLAVRRHLPTTERTHFSQYKSAQTLGVPPPPFSPPLPLLLRPTSLVLSQSVRRLPLAGDAALARARGARALEERAGAVEVEVEAAGGMGVVVGVEVGVEVSVAAMEAEAAAAVAVGAEVAEVVAVEEAAEAAGSSGGGGGGGRRRGWRWSWSRVYGEEWLPGGGFGPCTYVLRTSDRAGEQCGGAHPTQRCFGRLTDAWRHQFPEATEIPRWGELSRVGVAIYDLDFDAILSAINAVSISDEGDCYRCFPPDPGIETAALGTGEAAALGACDATALSASASAPSGTGEVCALSRPFAVSLADPSGGPVLSHFSTVLPCPAAPSRTLSGLYLPSFSTNLVSGADLQDGGVHQFTPARQRVTHCTEASTGRHLATFTRRPGSSLYTLTTASPPVATSGRVAASGQVFAAASRSGPESAPRSCRLLSHETLLWHHRLGHPSLLRLRGMASRLLVSARVRGQGHERYFLLVIDDYTAVFPLRSKGDVTEINLHPRISRSETFPALLWTGKAGDASAFRVWGSRAFVRDLSADKLSPRAAPCVFLGFPPDAPWVAVSTTPPLAVFCLPRTSRPPPVDPLPPQGPSPSGVSQVDAVEPVEVTGDYGAAEGAEPGGADSGGAEPGGAEPGGAATGGAEPGGAESWVYCD
ncbi:unnamed protein product [Closterium sp. NIES-64]|nr:unnamed protein product [Closterium sp. NIES-64]